MKKLLLLLLAVLLIGCEADELPQECNCVYDAKRYISFDNQETWHFNAYDGRHGYTLPCDFERELINERDGFWYKLVFKCRD